MNNHELVLKCIYTRNELQMLSAEIQAFVLSLEENIFEYNDDACDKAVTIFDSIRDNIVEIYNLLKHQRMCYNY